jgi:hypothetical protein
LREQAELLPHGAFRDQVLRKARQAENGSQMAEWLRPPGLHPPNRNEVSAALVHLLSPTREPQASVTERPLRSRLNLERTNAPLDLRDDDKVVPDEEGTELSSMEEVQNAVSSKYSRLKNVFRPGRSAKRSGLCPGRHAEGPTADCQRERACARSDCRSSRQRRPGDAH